MSGREPIDETAQAVWVEHAAAALEVDVSGVSPHAVHDLTGQVATRHQRSMALTSACLWGSAIATHPDRDPGKLARVTLDALPES